jgi:hypothetical protein
MTGTYYDTRIQNKIEYIFNQIQSGKVSAKEMVDRLAIEYYVKKIDEIDIVSRGRTDEFEVDLNKYDNPTKIFFTPEYKDEIPVKGQHISHPRTNVGYMIIINMGPNDVRYGTNRLPGDVNLKSLLKVNEFRNVPATHNTIFSLFLQTVDTLDENDAAVSDLTSHVRVEFIT